MFKKFSFEESVSSTSAVKSSQARAIHKKIKDAYPSLESKMDKIFPTKQSLMMAKCINHINICLSDGRPVFFNHRDGPFYPTVRLLHKYPDMMDRVQIDKGGIPYVLNGANIMCVGMTSPGGWLPEDLPVGSPVAVFAESKELPLAVGVLRMSTKEIRDVNKDIGVDLVHFLDDALWQYDTFDDE